MTPLLQVKKLSKTFYPQTTFFAKNKKSIKAVNGISFDIHRAKTLGMVGESGCGKSTVARLILRLTEPSSGEVFFDSTNIFTLGKSDMREMRKRIQVIFQDPYASLNPRMNVEQIVAEALIIHKLVRGKKQRQDRVVELLEKVGLKSTHLGRYPHEFSGGQRQRIGIARALAVEPELIIADEPVSALDVSIQAQIINLLEDLQRDSGITYLFISHDLSVIEHISDDVAVIYLGKVMEIATSSGLYNSPKHPYTESLLSAIPVPDPGYNRQKIILKGDPPSPSSLPNGCLFHPRCSYKKDICQRIEPPLTEVAKNHKVACHFAGDLNL